MTEQNHPITPPPELVQELYGMPQMRAIEAAFRAGADTELEACCKWLESQGWRSVAQDIRAARRPKPPSLKEQVKADIERERQEAADQELEACRQWLEINGAPRKLIDGLLVARCRPEPPSLKEDAMEALLRLAGCSNTFASEDTADAFTICRALEQLPPTSLKEDAMEALLRLAGCSNTFASEDAADVATIRRALEQLPPTSSDSDFNA